MSGPTVLERDRRILADAIAVFTGADPERSIYRYARSEVQVDVSRRETYSYGRHFPLFRFVPRALNGWRDLFVINGDAWNGRSGWGPSRTFTHQADSRRLIEATGRASVILPFSALNGAGIDLDSIRVIDVRPDKEWTETVTVRSLAELPRHERTVRFTREHSSARLEDMPASESRDVWRAPTAEELETVSPYGHKPTYNGAQYLPRIPDAGGLFHWTTSHERPRAANPDGTYSYDRRVHRLGDSLISAVRDGRRRRFLSSFDTNESPALYFLAQVPRGAGDTVAMALESLAPRAVHAAMARGLEVRRQGDIFFIDTALTRDDLEARGAVFARLTQWSRDARARKGEINYRPRQTAAEARRELRHARKLWRERSADTAGRAGAMVDRSSAREATRARWRELEARHARERREARAAGAPLDSPISSACDSCGATIGAPCVPVDDSGAPLLFERIENERRRNDDFHVRRGTLENQQANELSTLRHESRAVGRRANGAPVSAAGARRRARRDYLAAAARADTAAAKLRRELAAPHRHGPLNRYTYSAVAAARREYLARVAAARRELEYARDRLETLQDSRARSRDSYRDSLGTGGTVAVTLWREARLAAAARFRPDEFAPDRIARRRERARRALAVYGTAHTATEVARVTGGAVYVRGTISHRPDLEPGRRGDPDHAPLTLTPDHWYLAVRNTVPRQDTRGARRA